MASGQFTVRIHRQKTCLVIRRLGSRDRSVFCCLTDPILEKPQHVGVPKESKVFKVFNQLVFQRQQKNFDVHIKSCKKIILSRCCKLLYLCYANLFNLAQIGLHANVSPGLKATEVGSHNSKYVLRWHPRHLGENMGEIQWMFEHTNIISYVCICYMCIEIYIQ